MKEALLRLKNAWDMAMKGGLWWGYAAIRVPSDEFERQGVMRFFKGAFDSTKTTTGVEEVSKRNIAAVRRIVDVLDTPAVVLMRDGGSVVVFDLRGDGVVRKIDVVPHPTAESVGSLATAALLSEETLS